MLDKPLQTAELLTTLKKAAPFEVELPPSLMAHLRAEGGAADAKSRQIVSKVFYAGDEGGILCHIGADEGEKVLIVSLTHLYVPRTLPFADEARAYQKHRIK